MKLKLGVCGTGTIASWVCSINNQMPENNFELYACATSPGFDCSEFAQKYHFSKICKDYDALFADPEIDAVYIAVPNTFHYQLCKQALLAGKNVICEKPFAINENECNEIISLAEEKGVFLTEALWAAFVPCRKWITDEITAGTIGDVLSANILALDNVMFLERCKRLDLGGGYLLDTGSYTIGNMLFHFGLDIEKIQSSMRFLDTGVDAEEELLVTYKDGRTVSIHQKMDQPEDEKCESGEILGTKGKICYDNIANPRHCIIYDNAGTIIKQYEMEPQYKFDGFPPVCGYQYEIAAFEKALREGRLETEEAPHRLTAMIAHIMTEVRRQHGLVYPFEIGRCPVISKPVSMLQQVMTEKKQIVFQSVPIPEPSHGEVRVKIKRIGICGSDIHVYHGTHPFTSYPVTQGHEVSGIIDKIGEGVTKFHIGDKVTIEPQIYCGKCYPCTHGKYNLCEKLKVMGFQDTGTASEYFVTPETKITSLPEEMSFNEGAMIEPLAVTVHAAKRFPEIAGAKVAILGSGPIGILLAQSVKALGASEVMITDVSDYRLQLAAECGANYTYNTAKKDFGEALCEAFGPDKADVIYDCAGNDTTINQAIRYARKGSTIILVAVFAKMANVDLAVLNDHELDLNTTMMYRHEDYLDAIRLVSEGKIHLKPLMSKHFAFTDYLQAYEFIDANRETTMKILIDVDPEDD